MSSDWKEVRLDDICVVKGGKRLPEGHVLVDHKTAHPYIKARDIRAGKVSSSEIQFLEPATFDKIRRYTVNHNDVCITIVANIGDVGIVPKELDGANLTENAVKLTEFREDVDPRFLCLQLAHRQFKDFMESLAAGAAQSKLGIYKIKIVKVRLPPLETQQKIAAILSAYDELIEVNTRRIALLERLAEELYREWFVRFRFPGHESAAFSKGVPEGWEVTTSNTIFRVMSGGTPNTDNAVYWDGDIPFFTPRDAADNFYALRTDRTITQKGLDSCNSRLYGKDTIFITARGTVGKICMAYREMAMNQTCYALAPTEEGLVYFHFLSMKNSITYIKGVSKSGVFDNIVVDTFRIIPLFLPPAPLVATFNQQAAPIFQQVGNLLEQNELLSKTRDLLLPRLISGKLSVDSLSIAFPPAMSAGEA